MADTPRNIILLSADALRADHLSCYEYHRETTPELDSLAEEGIRFQNAYSASSHTREAVPALLTGKYPDVAVDSRYNLSTETVASTLSEEGYATAGFHSNPFVSRAYGFDRGFDHFDDDLHLGQHKLIALVQQAVDKLRNRHYARAEEINERSLAWLDSLDEDKPFFLWNHYMDTHGPYDPPDEYANLYSDTKISGRDAQSLYQRAINDPDSITVSERQLLINLYDGEIRYNDAKIGDFLEALRKRELLEESLLILTADHGDAFNDHGYYEHPRYLHDELTHVPLILRLPGWTGKVVDVPTSTLDIATIIESVMRGKINNETLLLDISGDRRVFSQARGEGDHNHLRRYAVRTLRGNCFCERNLESDEITFTDCTDKYLRDDLKTHIKKRSEVENRRPDSNDEVVDKAVQQRLDALGYTE